MHLEEGSRVGPDSRFPVLRRKGMRVVRQQRPQAGIQLQSQGCVAGGGGHHTFRSSRWWLPWEALEPRSRATGGCAVQMQGLQEQEGHEVSLGAWVT